MGTLLSILSSSTTAGGTPGGTYAPGAPAALAAPERPNINGMSDQSWISITGTGTYRHTGRSFPAVSVSPSARAPRTRETIPSGNTKLNRRRKRTLTSQETCLLEEACVVDEIQIIRQQILKQGIQLGDMLLPDDYCYSKRQQQQRQSVTMSLSDEYPFPLSVGSVVIEKSRIQALSYALSEYKLRGRIPNRTVYWVDGSVARRPGRKNLPGVAVVSKSKDEGSLFPWKIQGYKVHGRIGCPDIELLAILQALHIAFEEINEGAYGEQQIIVIYSDCQEALSMILHHPTRARRDSTNILLEGIIDLTIVLRSLYVSVELHWVLDIEMCQATIWPTTLPEGPGTGPFVSN